MELLDQYVNDAMRPLESAVSLPFEVYRSEEVFTAEQRRVFGREWVFLCMDRELAEPGDYLARTIADEPIVIVRGSDGALRGFSNICRHRGTPLVDEGRGRVDRHIVCPYHAWAYTLEGELKAIPYNDVIAVDRADHALLPTRVETWNGLVFVNLDPAARPLLERLSGLDDWLAPFSPQDHEYVSTAPDETWSANWKLAMENAMESYHLFKVHEQTLETFSPTRDAYYVAGSSEWSLTGGATERQEGLLDKLFGGSGPEVLSHYLLVCLPPSFVGVLTWGSFAWLSAHPEGPGRTRIRSGATLRENPGSMDRPLDDFTQTFFAEDQAICERVHAGMGSRNARGGKLVDMEQVVVDFHQFLGTRISGQPATPYQQNPEALKFFEAR